MKDYDYLDYVILYAGAAILLSAFLLATGCSIPASVDVHGEIKHTVSLDLEDLAAQAEAFCRDAGAPDLDECKRDILSALLRAVSK